MCVYASPVDILSPRKRHKNISAILQFWIGIIYPATRCRVSTHGIWIDVIWICLMLFPLTLFENTWYGNWELLQNKAFLEKASNSLTNRDFIFLEKIIIQTMIWYPYNTKDNATYTIFVMLPKICYISHRIPWKGLEVAVRCIVCKNFIHNLHKRFSLCNIQTLYNILASLFKKGSIFQYLSSTISAGFH